MRIPSRRTRQDRCFAVFFALVFPTIAFLPSTQNNNARRTVSSTDISFTKLYNNHNHQPSPPSSSRKKIRRKHWDEMVPRLRDFRNKHGHARVTQEHDDPELHEWVRNIRYNYLHQIRNITDASDNPRKRLSEKKLKILQELDFCWKTKRKWKRWDIMIQRLEQFKQEQGHTHVTKSDGDLELYEWTKYIRYNYRHQALGHITKSYRPRLATTKLQTLQDIGFHWETKRKINRWDVMLPILKDFQDKHGNTLVQETDDLELYKWTQNLIRNYGPQLLNVTTTTNRKLSKEKLLALQTMGFSWENRSSMWDRRYQELRAFRKQHGHCHAPTREYPQLGVFVQNQRQEYRRYLANNVTTLTSERIKLLQRIDFEWARSHELAWEERLGDLEDYSEQTGNSNVPQDYANNNQLGQWCMNQRTMYRIKNAGQQTGLTSERIRKLDKVDFQWNNRQVRWQAMSERLKQYQEDNGHMEIQTSDIRNRDLRLWLNEQRHYYKTEGSFRVTPERIESLEAIANFSWNRSGKGPLKSDWNQLFVAIKEKGIAPGGKAKEHWFDGANRFDKEVKTEWTEKELLSLWNEENDEDEDEGEEKDEEDDDEGEYFEDEESRLFLRA